MLRIETYDLFKGALLCVMFATHVLLNIYQDHFPYYQFSFSTGAFIFLSAMMLAELKRVQTAGLQVFLRGVKLVILFVVLNMLGQFILYRQVNLPTPYTLLVGDITHTSFEILLPMGYLLMSASLLEKLPYSKQLGISIFVILLIIPISQRHNYNVLFYLVGTMGYLLGKNVTIDRLSSKIKPTTFSILILAITILFGGMVLKYHPSNWAILLLRGSLILQLLFWITKLRSTVFLKSALQLLGRNSFFVYILQISVLKIVTTSVAIKGQSVALTILGFVAIAIMSLGTAILVDYLRGRSDIFRRIYASLL